MYAADVLRQVLFPCEAGARAALAVCEGAEERLFGAAMHLMYFALVTQETTAVGKALQLLAPLDETLVGPVMLVHVLAR